MTGLETAERVPLLVVGIALSYGVLRILVPAIARHTHYQLDHIVVSATGPPIIVLAALGGLWWSLAEELPAHPARLTFTTLIVLAFWWLSARIVGDITTSFAETVTADTDAAWDDITIPLIHCIGMPVTVVLGIAMWLVIAIGMPWEQLLAVLGALSFILVFAHQDPLSNMFSGIYLLIGQPFQIGAFIQLEDDDTYRVEELGSRVTTLHDVAQHTAVYVPNLKLASEKIVNTTSPTVELRLQIDVGIGFESDAEQALAILERLCEEHPHVLSSPARKLAILQERVENATATKLRLLASVVPGFEHISWDQCA